jgi:hypothetical protein
VVIMTTSPTQPDLRRNLFQPGDRVRIAACAPKLCLDPDAHQAIGTVQPYPKDTATIEVVYDGEQVAVVYYVEELHLLSLVEPAPAPEAVERACRQCGCTTENACQSAGPAGLETCSWAEIDLCSTCADDQATDVPEATDVPDYAASIYHGAVNLVYLTELLDGRHDALLNIGWDEHGGRVTTLHLGNTARAADGAALADRIGLTNYKAKPYEGAIHHRWTGERHGLPVEVVWVERDPAPVETPEAGA